MAEEIPKHKDIAETLHPLRTRKPSFYIVLLLLVVPFWSAVPLCWLFVVYTLNSGKIWSLSWKGATYFLLALCEVIFSVYHYHLAQHISSSPPYYGPGDVGELQAAFQRMLQAGLSNLLEDDFDEETLTTARPGSPAETIERLEYDNPRAADFRNVLRTWFNRVPWSSIRRHEMYIWLYWSIYNATLPPIDSLPHSHRVVLDEALELLQKRAGCTIPEGSTPSNRPLCLTLDKVNVTQRPFAWYISVTIANWLLKIWFRRRWNTMYGSYNGLEYLVRIPPNWNPVSGPRPIVFLYGLGLGLVQYHLFLTHLMDAFPDRPLLIPVQPHISHNIFHARYLRPMGRHETAKCLAGLMAEFGWVQIQTKNEKERTNINGAGSGQRRNGVTMLSHSNGSYAHAWMLKEYPEMITRSCFIDPVTFCSWEGDVCYNFIYRPCTTGTELAMSYFVGTELGVANLLQRHFDWSSNSLWYEEIPNANDPNKTLFVLGGKDDIVNADRVKRYLLSHGVRKCLWLDPRGRHGQALITGGKGHTEILRWLQRDH